MKLLPMHSLISFEDQMAAFDTTSGDKRTRIVVATNIAESSVTIPNVHTVIDFGRVRTIEYVPAQRTSMLRTTWISQASALQRSGRAGRVCPGTVVRLYSRSFFERVMPKYDVPEMLRLTLDSVVLKVKILGIRTPVEEMEEFGYDLPPQAAAGAAGLTVNSAKAVLGKALQAPSDEAVDTALEHLAALGALESQAVR